jgi:hypothetical protein
MMSAEKRRIERSDIVPMAEYETQRKERRKKLVEVKRNRRIDVGPVCTFYFENYETMWHQVHEMLYIEKGGEEQIEDELTAYNPLIPQGRELVATVMFEIDDPIRRRAFLSKLGGVEETAFIDVEGAERIHGKPEEDVDRTTADGKASSVQFIHFPVTDAQAEAIKRPNAKVTIGFTHGEYGHMAVMSEDMRAALAADLA